MPEKKFELKKMDFPQQVTYAARCRPLGLTAYGSTTQDAIKKLKRMFSSWVDVHVKEVIGD